MRECTCGCGQPATNRGGYNRRLGRTAWFASNECQARFETAAIQLRARYVDQFGGQAPVTLDLGMIQTRIRDNEESHA